MPTKFRQLCFRFRLETSLNRRRIMFVCFFFVDIRYLP